MEAAENLLEKAMRREGGDTDRDRDIFPLWGKLGHRASVQQHRRPFHSNAITTFTPLSKRGWPRDETSTSEVHYLTRYMPFFHSHTNPRVKTRMCSFIKCYVPSNLLVQNSCQATRRDKKQLLYLLKFSGTVWLELNLFQTCHLQSDEKARDATGLRHRTGAMGVKSIQKCKRLRLLVPWLRKRKELEVCACVIHACVGHVHACVWFRLDK